jgi:hypothetical protein
MTKESLNLYEIVGVLLYYITGLFLIYIYGMFYYIHKKYFTLNWKAMVSNFDTKIFESPGFKKDPKKNLGFFRLDDAT